MKNPFYFRVLPLDAPFCDREDEMASLLSHAKNMANVVIYSPRRYGKTSLVRRVQGELKKQGIMTAYVDFFGVASIDNAASRIAARLYSHIKESKNLSKRALDFLRELASMWKISFQPDPASAGGFSVGFEPAYRTSGFEVLDKTLESFGKMLETQNKGFNVVIDEFQEITELKEAAKLEALLRTHIQRHSNASYFFLGSRRRLLVDMFTQRTRPFYQSAISMPLNPLPRDKAAVFIAERFKDGGKTCPSGIAEKITDTVECYPYYVQRLPYSVYEVSDKEITADNLENGFKQMLEEESAIFEGMFRVLSQQQKKAVNALAVEPTQNIFSAAYMETHRLGSLGGVQGAVKKLIELDYIYTDKASGIHRLTDPIFGIWVKSQGMARTMGTDTQLSMPKIRKR